ncbi:MAG TPA: glycosyltransferase [Paenibacillus sp.]|uniref:glycosyltransferase family protein n=1 Tax=Paenibacillus sp. TaxID=58172 RepID=UPI002BB91D10|nr:glycosyltransferase [Paenibacillus sp.]HUC92010.1 glycosyltransferase [Paenibacillus sp.]
MKLLFFNPEQYINYENEPSNFELRLPILHCGAVSDHKDFIYHREYKQHGREEMNRRALYEVQSYRPDLIVYSTGWSKMSIAPEVWAQIRGQRIPVYIHLWDTILNPDANETMHFMKADYLGVADSVSRYEYYKSMNHSLGLGKKVIFTGGNNVFTDLIKYTPMAQIYDVVMLGSKEGKRVELYEYLNEQLPRQGAAFHKFGGLVDNQKGSAEQGLTDQWVPMETYVQIINQSKICISSQTAADRYQVKGKVFEYLACGTLCLTEHNEELKKIVPESCLVYYTDFEDCQRKIMYYLEHEDERKEIARRGFEWFHRTYDYKTFWSNFLNAVKSQQIAEGAG